ncbi:MAG: substrate-binding domain-containing protein, partial [Aquisalimonadaceae bacterium]
TGYIPNGVAGSLASRRSRVISALVPTITHSIFADAIHGLADVLSASGYQVLLGATGYSLLEESRLVTAMLAQRPAGMLVTGMQHNAQTMSLLRASEIPIVETWTVDGDPVDMAVGFSNIQACKEIVKRVAAGGAHRIGYISAPIVANDRAAQRLLGYRRAVRELDLDADPGLEQTMDRIAYDAGAQGLAELLKVRPDVQAICCANDVLAIGALLECQRRGIRVPDDLIIAGFDDMELATQINPSLTTVRIPRYGIGRQAATMILQCLQGEQVEHKVIDLGFEIIERESTGVSTPA